MGPWGIGVDGGEKLNADYGRISAAPKFGTREVWHLVGAIVDRKDPCIVAEIEVGGVQGRMLEAHGALEAQLF